MWIRGELAGESVLEAGPAGVRLVFSMGPRWAAGQPEDRARRLLGALAPQVRGLRWCRQVHGRLMASLSPGEGGTLAGAACAGRCDGLLTDDPGVALLVWTADCVPVLLHGGGVAAAVHAGWRGVAAGIVPAAVRRFTVEYGVPPHEIRAALGPSVGSCHYEVGQEVLDLLARVARGSVDWRQGDRVDLRALLEGQLQDAGLPREAIERVGGCTACDPGLASYRRDGERAGRQFSLVFLRP